MPQMLSPIPVRELFAYADGQIRHAAESLWPGAGLALGPHTASVTGYVRTVEVNGTVLYAKVSLLGMSLVSVVRGSCGSWSAVRAAQDAYTASPQTLLAREAEQLRLLPVAGLRAPLVAGYTGGVLFTQPVVGPTLAEVLVKEPDRTDALCARVLREVGEGLARIAPRVTDAVAIGERSIPATFVRKFNGLSGRAYLEQAGAHTGVLGAIVARLQGLRLAPAAASRPVVFGDLKPEHIVFPDGPDGQAAFLDPGMARGRSQADHAKLVSRLILGLFTAPLSAATVHAITAGLASLVGHTTAALTKLERTAWLRELLMLWAMDTVNILSTYLTCPVVLPMPVQAVTLTQKAPMVLALLDTVSADLVARQDPRTVWTTTLARLSKAVAV
ncbi:hypothetical protein [Streptomyces melanogenes]|uniref:hypothetical protein n=1 Tax=Streptomyces melanogenes TaxID=67326 RepID=UPI00167CAF41|nr:hypothetical protein [Streptomyces melanogenes]GGP80091.1 hypothetical protein GCM10010278_68180 [Streptomyces melanogenes]